MQEAIYKFILEKKKEYEKKMAEYGRQKDAELEEMREMASMEKDQLKQKFEQREKSIVTKKAETAAVAKVSFNQKTYSLSGRC